MSNLLAKELLENEWAGRMPIATSIKCFQSCPSWNSNMLHFWTRSINLTKSFVGMVFTSLSSRASPRQSLPSSCGILWYAPIMSDVTRAALMMKLIRLQPSFAKLSKFSQVYQRLFKYSQILLSFAKLSQVQTSLAKFSQVQPSSAKFSQVQTSLAEVSHIQPSLV